MTHGRFDNPVIVVLTCVKDFFQKTRPERTVKTTNRIYGRRVIVTDANYGLGFALAVKMAQSGGHVMMACRKQ